jgi:Big-like domain-containing protein
MIKSMNWLSRPRLFVGALVAVAAVASCQEVTGPIWVDSLQLEPDSLFLVPGETGQFTSVPLDQRDNPLTERSERTDWSVSNGSVASIVPAGGVAEVTAVKAGTTTVRVSLGRGTGTGRVYVEPQELSDVRIDPGNNGPIELGQTSGFGNRTTVRPILIGLDGQEVSPDGYRISWRTSNTDIFIMVGRQEVVTSTSISISGRSSGSATLTLAVGDRSVSVPIIVN